MGCLALGLSDSVGLIGLVVTVALVAAVLWLLDWLLLRRHPELSTEERSPRQALLLVLTVVGIVAVMLAWPAGPNTRELMLGVVGLVLSAVIALSSTTFVANAMAGLMLRSVQSFRPGDFIRVGEQFGRVTERGLFHTEIQTADRDLTTLPNLYLVSNPLTVVRSSGTIVSATLSLGYDVAHAVVEPLLIEAARQVELRDPFVQITELGDFSVGYRIAGFLADPRELISTRTTLRRKVLDVLHAAGIEIVSPAFMNQRALAPGARMIPRDRTAAADPAPAPPEPENIIFDKADTAAKVETLRNARAALHKRLDQLTEQLKGAADEQHAGVEQRIEHTKTSIERLDQRSAATEEEMRE